MSFKIMTIVGTRPEIIKMSMVIRELDECFDHVLVHTGQNYDYELSEVFFNDMGIRKPDYFLEASKESPACAIGDMIAKIDPILEKENPDGVVLYGDTNSCLTVISAKRKKIPIFHLEAGNRCFDQRVPEEINRKIVDHLSDINFVHSEHARKYLQNEGIRPEYIFKSGSPMNEVLENFKEKIDSSSVLSEQNLKEGEYFVVSIHREENVDSSENFDKLLNSLNAIAETYSLPVLVSTHPRTKKKLESKEVQHSPLINFSKPLGFTDYVALQKNAKCVISDSGTITEESSILGFPAVMCRQAHERPEGMDVGAVIMAGVKKTEILDSIELAIKLKGSAKQIEDYSGQKVSKQVAKIIQSYIPHINTFIWRKN